MRVKEQMFQICVPVFLSENDGFKYASKTLRDDMATYCVAMLEAGCIPEEKSGKGKWGRVSQRKLEKYIRRTSIRSTREVAESCLGLVNELRPNSVRHAACMSLRVILGAKNINRLAR